MIGCYLLCFKKGATGRSDTCNFSWTVYDTINCRGDCCWRCIRNTILLHFPKILWTVHIIYSSRCSNSFLLNADKADNKELSYEHH